MEDWQAVADEVAAALAEVGSSLLLSRTVPGTADPDQPWEPVAPAVLSEAVPQFGQGSGKYRTGETAIATDFEYMIAVPTSMVPRPGDMVSDGVEQAVIVKVEPFPAGGVPVYFTIWANR